MNDADFLRVNGLSEEMLKSLSRKSKLGMSLKKNLHYFEREMLLQELFNYADWLNEQDVFTGTAIDYRIKSYDSIELKYDRYYPDGQARKVFNDILGFRAFCDGYDKLRNYESDVFRIVDMSDGKARDDGYRGVHLYYQVDNNHYPIELQYNTYYDRQLLNWLHKYVYKRKYPNKAGKLLRAEYESGKIKNENDFLEVLPHVLSCCQEY